MTVRSDLLKAARFLLEEGASLETEEAIRIGLTLAQIAGAMSVRSRRSKGSPA
jgi:hypothetical protein